MVEPLSADEHSDIPLVVDLDGTLIRTDVLIESLFCLASHHPLRALTAVGALRHGKAAMKAAIADKAELNVDTLPLNHDMVALLTAERAKGRRLFLASASDRRYVQAFADHLGLFDGVFASDGTTNLGGAAKARVLCDAFGEGGFDYAGDAAVDMAVWAKARGGWVVNAKPSVLRSALARFPNLQVLGRHSVALKSYSKALRCHQWLKNLLIFVPALAGHAFGGVEIDLVLAFISFSLCASSVYVLNDLVDLANDREHPTKSRRPFASGTLPLLHGVALFPVLLLSALGAALFLPLPFLAVLAGYYICTVAYSFRLKKVMTLDVVVLSALYGVRLLAGAAATQIPVSSWLAAFAIFLFFSLALVKRSTELLDRIAAGKGDPVGRGYRLADLPILQSMAAASGYVAVLVMALYINSPAVTVLYSEPDRLWLICVVLIYWISRILLLTQRGEMHEDPVVFAATDRVSLISAGLIVAVVVASI